MNILLLNELTSDETPNLTASIICLCLAKNLSISEWANAEATAVFPIIMNIK